MVNDEIEAMWGDAKDDDFPEEQELLKGILSRKILETPLNKYRNGYLCVSDLSSQSWCEQKMLYSFTMPQIQEPPHIAVGSTLHLARELAVQDIIEVQVSSSEDAFAVKVLNLLGSVKDLLSGVPVRREIPVFGIPFECGIFFMGIIDEIRCDHLTLDIDLIEFKTRKTKSHPSRAQKKSHILQVMLYKCLLDSLIKNQLSKKDIANFLHLDLDKKLSKGVIEYLGPQQCHLDCINKLLDEMFSILQALPLVNQLMIEYCHQDSSETFHMELVHYNSEWLHSEIKQLLPFWTGERAAVGVEIEEAWKCRMCEYADVCEWRLSKVKEHVKRMHQKLISNEMI